MDKFGRLMLGNTCIAIGARAMILSIMAVSFVGEQSNHGISPPLVN